MGKTKREAKEPRGARAARAYEKAMALRGKIKLDINLDQARERT